MEQRFIEFSNVSFTYPDLDRMVFENLSMKLNGGFTSLVGQNGTGKSTLMLLASGRFKPENGKITINGTDTAALSSEEERNKLVSFVYQNMEFETNEPVGDLFEYVYANSNYSNKSDSFIPELIKTFRLTDAKNKKLQHMNKGDIQKAVIIFSLLYGSPIIMMDEPVFALESKDKESIMEYLKNYSKSSRTSIYLSIHDLDLSKKYTDNVILIHKNKKIEYGKTADLLTNEKLEEVYGVPAGMLYEKENLFRKHLHEEYDLIKEQIAEQLIAKQTTADNHKN